MNIRFFKKSKTNGAVDTPSVYRIWLRYFSAIMGILIVVYILTHNIIRLISNENESVWFTFWFTLVFMHLIIKYGASFFHTSKRYKKPPKAKWPSISIIIPAYNEGEAIYTTAQSILKCDYPKELIEMFIVNDGSTDDTEEWIKKIKKMNRSKKSLDFHKTKIKTRYINLRKNGGKKMAMAAGIKNSKNRILVFVDSDSRLDKNCLKEIVKPYFKSNKIGAVCGHARVWNADQNKLTKIQEIRYLQGFRALKATESLMGFVSCCSGCASSYERAAVLSVLDVWVNQTFLGAKCKTGDDRSLTNLVLKSGWNTVYNQNAIVYTIVPATMRKFMRQQLRWKRSWARENVVLLSYVWKRSVLTSTFMIVNMLVGLMFPVVIVKFFMHYSSMYHIAPINYMIGASVFSLLYGLFYQYYYLDSKRWLTAALLSPYLNILLVWQTAYAILTVRDSGWGTR